MVVLGDGVRRVFSTHVPICLDGDESDIGNLELSTVLMGVRIEWGR